MPRTGRPVGRPPKPKVVKPRPSRGRRLQADEKPYERAEEEFRRIIEKRTETAIDGIEAWGRNALADGSIPEASRPALEAGLARLRFNFEHFKRLLEPLRDEHPDVLQDINRRFYEIFRSLGNIAAEGGGVGFRKVFKQAGGRGGINAARTNLAKAEARWRGEARKLVKEIWQNGALAQDDGADQVQARWKGDPHDLPEHRQIKNLIAEMQRSGEISRKNVRASRA
jgi:hypothetical protein